jgi:hypothetical protein
LGEVSETGFAKNGNPLGDPVVMIAPNRISRVAHRPTNARRGVWSIVDQVAQTKAYVKRLVNRGKGGPVRVDVRNNKNPHVVLFAWVSPMRQRVSRNFDENAMTLFKQVSQI